MKNLVKSYFCLMARAPFLIMFALSALVFVTIAFGALALYSDDSGSVPSSIIFKPFGIYLIFAVLHIVVNYKIREKYITYTDDDESYVLFAVLVTKDGRRIIITKPIWEKGELYLIKLQYKNYFCYPEDNLIFHLSIDSRFRHSTISVPIEIEIEMKSDFDKLELFNSLLKNNTRDGKIFLVEDFFEKSFEKLNESNKEKFDQLVSEYGKKNISESELLDQIIEILIFPDIPSSGFETKKICLKAPKVSACKSGACEG